MPEESDFYSLYIHIPFCIRKCAYCDFYSSSADLSSVSAYIHALKVQFSSFKAFRNKKKMDTLYIGGGTPSILDAKQWKELSGIWEDETEIREITVEVNPASLSKEKLVAYRESGVNRISMGIQSFQDPVLEKMGRIADARALEEALDLLQNNWTGHWSIDLIYGYPGSDLQSSLTDIALADRWEAPHISLYQLTLEEDTPLAKLLNANEKKALWEKQDQIWPVLKDDLFRRNYKRYEISNFSRNQPCLHNLHYWNMDSWLGLGTRASGFIHKGLSGGWHYSYSGDIRSFIQQAETGFSEGVYESEEVQGFSYVLELLMMGLRSTSGVSLEKLDAAAFPWKKAIHYISQRFNPSYLKVSGERLVPSDEGMDYHNSLMLALMDFLQDHEY